MMRSDQLKMLTLAELKSATRNFRTDSEVSDGVFKGWIDQRTYAPSKVGVGMAVAVKKSNPDTLQEWEAEVELWGKLSHPNLVRLVGYCREDKEKYFFFVYEYMQRGTLENHLFTTGAETLSWEIRLKVAIGVARGLHHLHTSPQPVIHKNLKPSNIFLDQNLNAKLSGFGLEKLGPANDSSYLTVAVVRTFDGYATPEYIAAGGWDLRCDVYGFGVVLLELVTGLRVVDTKRPRNQINLVEWAKPLLSEKKKVKKIMDPRLEDRYPMEGAWLVGELVLKCVQHEPKKRPSMGQVVDALEMINAIAI